MNGTYAVTASSVYNAFMHITDPTIPRNEGCYRPINVIAPPGTIVNCEFPAPLVGGNTELSPRITDIIFGALADALPERIPASHGGTVCCFLFGGRASRRPATCTRTSTSRASAGADARSATATAR